MKKTLVMLIAAAFMMLPFNAFASGMKAMTDGEMASTTGGTGNEIWVGLNIQIDADLGMGSGDIVIAGTNYSVGLDVVSDSFLTIGVNLPNELRITATPLDAGAINGNHAMDLRLMDYPSAEGGYDDDNTPVESDGANVRNGLRLNLPDLDVNIAVVGGEGNIAEIGFDLASELVVGGLAIAGPIKLKTYSQIGGHAGGGGVGDDPTYIDLYQLELKP